MPNGHFQKVRDLFLKILNVIRAKVMASVDSQTRSVCRMCRLDKGFDPFRIPTFIGLCITFGIQFDTVCTSFRRTFYHPYLRVYKNGGSYSIFMKLRNDLP